MWVDLGEMVKDRWFPVLHDLEGNKLFQPWAALQQSKQIWLKETSVLYDNLAELVLHLAREWEFFTVN